MRDGDIKKNLDIKTLKKQNWKLPTIVDLKNQNPHYKIVQVGEHK